MNETANNRVLVRREFSEFEVWKSAINDQPLFSSVTFGSLDASENILCGSMKCTKTGPTQSKSNR